MGERIHMPERKTPKGRWHSRGRKLLRMAGELALLLVLLALVPGCGWTVTPPPRPKEPAVVFLADYGRHSRLAVQTSGTGLVEYGYGDWRFYALGEKGLWSGLRAVAKPTPSALARRTLPPTDDPAVFRQRAGADRAARFLVERERADDLLRELDRRYRKNIDTEFRRETSGFSFIRDDEPYHLLHNSNHQTAEWLRHLGCEVRGPTVHSNFRVEPQDRPTE